MPLTWSQYKTAASGDIEAMLQSSNSILAIAGIVSGDNSQIIYATASGISCIQRAEATGISLKKGYFAQTDIKSLATDGTYLYVGYGTAWTTGNIGRITIASLFNNGDSDRAADYTNNWGTTGTGPALPSTYMVLSLDCKSVSGTYYLAIGIKNFPYIYNVTTGASYYGCSFGPVYSIALTDAGDLFAATKIGVAFKNSVHSEGASGWTWTGFFGNADDDYADGVVHSSWSDIFAANSGTPSLAEAGGKLRFQHISGGTNSYCDMIRHGTVTGDFDIKITGLGGDNGAALVGADYVQRRAIFYLTNTVATTSDYFSVYQKYTETQLITYSVIRIGGSTVATNTSTVATPGLAGQDAGYFRFIRTGTTITIKWSTAGGAEQTGATYTNAAVADVPVYLNAQIYLSDKNTDTAYWDIYDFANNAPTNDYSDFPKLMDIKGVAASIPAATLNLVAAMAGGGVNAIEVDQAAPLSSVIYQYRVSGGDVNVLTSLNCTCCKLESDGLTAWIGTSDAGLDRINLTAQSCDNFTELRGKLIDDAIVAVLGIQSAAYGGASGAGYLTGDTTAPDDQAVYVAGRGDNCVLLAWREDDDVDLDHMLVYRSVNDAALTSLLSDDSWGAPGTKKEFQPGDERLLSLLDEDVADGKYEYVVSQVDVAGNESQGTVATIYMDEPVASVTIYGGASSTTTVGIFLQVDADSGDDSGNESGAGVVPIIEVAENSSFTGSKKYSVTTAGPWILPWTLSAGDGLKNLYVRGVSESGKVGSAASTSITLAVETTTAPSTSETKIMVSKAITSDSASLSCINADTTFPVSNLQEARLARVWRPTAWQDVSSDFGVNFWGAQITVDFGTAKTINAAWMGNHNLATLATGSTSMLVYLHGSTSQHAVDGSHGQIYNWYTDAEYTVDLTNQISRHSFCCRPQVAYRYWAITILRVINVNVVLPYIGRLVMLDSADIWTPSVNFKTDFRLSAIDQSIIHETEDEGFEAVAKNIRQRCEISFNAFSRANWATARSVFRSAGRHTPMLVLLRPDDFNNPSTSTADWNFDPMYCLASADWNLRGMASEHGAFGVELLEITGGSSPYGT